jgi:hypothetical protein
MPAAAAPAQLETLDRNDLNAGLDHPGTGVGLAFIGNHHAGSERGGDRCQEAALPGDVEAPEIIFLSRGSG